MLEYEAITNFIGAPGFTTIGPDEFIVDIARVTRRVDVLGTVEYSICTRSVGIDEEGVEAEGDHNNDNDRKHKDYTATLTVIPNPGIGPNIVTVNSIVPCRDRD